MILCRYLMNLSLLFAGACAGAATTSFGATAPVPPFQQGQIIDTVSGLTVDPDQLIATLLQQEVIYLGEEHHNRYHVDTAVHLLQRLVAHHRQPVLAMEMFGWDGQSVIDRYLSTAGGTREEFLDQVRWQQSWGGPFED